MPCRKYIEYVLLCIRIHIYLILGKRLWVSAFRIGMCEVLRCDSWQSVDFIKGHSYGCLPWICMCLDENICIYRIDYTRWPGGSYHSALSDYATTFVMAKKKLKLNKRFPIMFFDLTLRGHQKSCSYFFFAELWENIHYLAMKLLLNKRFNRFVCHLT